VLGGKGVLGLNYIGFPDDETMASLLKTIGEAFADVRAFKTEDSVEAQTICVLASNNELELSSRRWLPDMDWFEGVDPISALLSRHKIVIEKDAGIVLRDDHNPIDFQRARAAIHWRKKTASILGAEASLW